MLQVFFGTIRYIHIYRFFFQNCGIGSKLLSYAESLGSIQELIIPSARTDLISYYDKKGYKEMSRFNFADTEDTTTAEFIKHTGVEMITMQKIIMKF